MGEGNSHPKMHRTQLETPNFWSGSNSRAKVGNLIKRLLSLNQITQVKPMSVTYGTWEYLRESNCSHLSYLLST